MAHKMAPLHNHGIFLLSQVSYLHHKRRVLKFHTQLLLRYHTDCIQCTCSQPSISDLEDELVWFDSIERRTVT